MLSFTKSSTSTMTMANGEVVSVTGVDTMWRYELGSCNSLVSTKIDENDDEDRVGNSLLQIWKLRFGHKTKLLFRQSTRFGQYSEARFD